MKYFLHLAYKGTHYRGWQRQLNIVSIQQTLEETLSKMLGRATICVGCGRTEEGVHARQFYCHIVVEKPLGDDPVKRLNNMLPDDILVYEFLSVSPHAHAQHDATARTYEYHIHGQKNVFISDLSAYYVFENLDIEKMKSMVELVRVQRDFRALCQQPNLYKHTICKVKTAAVSMDTAEQRILFKITADRFLRGMNQLIVGSMLEVGYGKMPLAYFEACLKTGTFPQFCQTANPQGLYLTKIVYPYIR